MKNNVENMEEEMKSLSSNMVDITSCSDQINTTLSTRREKIEQLAGVHRLLKKVIYVLVSSANLHVMMNSQFDLTVMTNQDSLSPEKALQFIFFLKPKNRNISSFNFWWNSLQGCESLLSWKPLVK